MFQQFYYRLEINLTDMRDNFQEEEFPRKVDFL